MSRKPAMVRGLTSTLLITVSLVIATAAIARSRPDADEMRRMRRCDAMSHWRAMHDPDCVRLMHAHHGMQQHGGRMMKLNG